MLVFRDVAQRLPEEAAGQFLVVYSGLVEEAVENAPVAVSETENDERLDNGASCEGEEVSEDQSLHLAEGTILLESRPVHPQPSARGRRARSPPVRYARGSLRCVWAQLLPPYLRSQRRRRVATGGMAERSYTASLAFR